MDTRNLMTSQSDIRNPDRLDDMAAFVKEGGFFVQEVLSGNDKNLIEIVKFPDGKLMVHNGHHRCISIYNARPSKQLDSSEYYVIERTYESYLTANPPLFLTPFDPRTEVRLGEFRDFKYIALSHFNDRGYIEDWLFSDFWHMYKAKRAIDNFYISSLAMKYSKRCDIAAPSNGV